MPQLKTTDMQVGREEPTHAAPGNVIQNVNFYHKNKEKIGKIEYPP